MTSLMGGWAEGAHVTIVNVTQVTWRTLTWRARDSGKHRPANEFRGSERSYDIEQQKSFPWGTREQRLANWMQRLVQVFSLFKIAYLSQRYWGVKKLKIVQGQVHIDLDITWRKGSTVRIITMLTFSFSFNPNWEMSKLTFLFWSICGLCSIALGWQKSELPIQRFVVSPLTWLNRLSR